MKKLTCEISVGGWSFDFVTNVEIVSSWDRLADTCKIEIPRNITYKRDGVKLTNFIGGEDPVFFRGDSVIVKLGYDGFLKTRFVGRLVDVIPHKPLILMCEDEMYRMKQASIEGNIDFENGTLRELIDRLFTESSGGGLDFLDPEEDVRVADITIGKISIKDTTVAKVLEFLRKKMGIVSYWRHLLNDNGDPIPYFVSGLAYSTEGDKFQASREINPDGTTSLTGSTLSINEEFTTIFRLGTNIISDEDLVYKRLNDQSVKVIGKSKQKDNSVLVYEAGNTGGDVVRFNYPELSQEELESFVQERLRRSKYEGMEGSFEAFLEPMVEHGETVQIINEDFPEKEGIYLIKDVTTRFGVNGGRQIITLDSRVDAPVLEEEPSDFG